MTQQVPDFIAYDGSSWGIREISGDRLWLFSPRDFGLQHEMGSTACWLGHICTFALREGILILDRLDLTGYSDMPLLFGRAAKEVPDEERILIELRMAYTNLATPIEYTGGLLLGRGWPDDYNTRWDIPGIWTNIYVAELLFDQGRLTAALDHSKAFAALRAWIKGELMAHRWSGPEMRARANAITQCAYFNY